MELAICILWKKPLALRGVHSAQSQNTSFITMKPSAMPMSGEVNRGMITLLSTPCQITWSTPAV